MSVEKENVGQCPIIGSITTEKIIVMSIHSVRSHLPEDELEDITMVDFLSFQLNTFLTMFSN